MRGLKRKFHRDDLKQRFWRFLNRRFGFLSGGHNLISLNSSVIRHGSNGILFSHEFSPVWKQATKSSNESCNPIFLENVVVSTISGNVFKKIEGSNFYLVESDYRHPYQALWSRGRPNKDPKSYFLGKCAVIPKRSGNYFHFFVEELPDILLEIEHVPNRILANHKIPNFQRDFLENFFQLEFTKYSEIRVETLIKATKSQCSSDIYSIERLSRVRALTNGLESNTHDSRIFVLRDSTDQVELGIARAFHSRGFRIETLVELPIFEQIRLFKNARCIVGFAGAGLTNLLFVNELSESTLVEICIDDMSNKYWKKSVAGPCWEPFALTLGAKYLFLYLNPYKDINSQIGYFIEEQLNN